MVFCNFIIFKVSLEIEQGIRERGGDNIKANKKAQFVITHN